MASPSETSKTGAKVPLSVWLVIGDKPGDNAQVQSIAEALGWPCEYKRIYFRAPYDKGRLRFKASLCYVDMARSDLLEPPWPELMITAGRRPFMVAMWIRSQSGGHTKVVALGRPRRMLDQLDLVIAPAQFRLPKRPNVLPIDFPLTRLNTEAIATAAAAWQPRLAALPRPLIALFVGGQTHPFRFNAKVANRLIERAGRVAAEAGGTLYITTSRRTPAKVVEALRTRLPANTCLYQWSSGGGDNPYLALLGLADRFIVTGDSVSMMVEVARLGKPLAIFTLPSWQKGLASLGQLCMSLLHPPAGDGGRGGLLQPLGDLLYRLGWVGYSRDITAIHRLLIRSGLAVRLGEPFLPPGSKPPDERPRVVERIKALMAD